MKFKMIIILLLNLIINNIYAEEKILNVFTWSGYLPESIIQEFEQQTNIHIHHSTYVNNEVLYAKLKASPDAGYDIIMPSAYFIERMIKQQLIRHIDKTKLINFNNINPIFLNKEYDQNNDYSIPYLYTATGIVINKKYHNNFSKNKECLWKNLWDPNYKEQLLIFNDAREVFGIALIKLGYSVNDTNPNHIKQAFESLNNLMKNVKLFNTEAQRSIYLDEDITIGMGWNGDIFLASKENPHLNLIYPKDGFIISLDCLAIPAGAKHIDYAHQFIDFVLQANIAKSIALISGFSTANLAGMKLLPSHIKNNNSLYPNKETMKRAQILNDVGNAILIYEKYFELLRS